MNAASNDMPAQYNPIVNAYATTDRMPAIGNFAKKQQQTSAAGIGCSKVSAGVAVAAVAARRQRLAQAADNTMGLGT